MKRNFKRKMVAGAAAAAMAASPAAAMDLGLERDAEAYAGAYFSVPFGATSKTEQADEMKFGLQVDRDAGGRFSPFDSESRFEQNALVDISFDTSLNMTGLSMNGIDALELNDQLYQNNDDRGGWFWSNVGWVFLGGAVAIIAFSDNNDDTAPKATTPPPPPPPPSGCEGPCEE